MIKNCNTYAMYNIAAIKEISPPEMQVAQSHPHAPPIIYVIQFIGAAHRFIIYECIMYDLSDDPPPYGGYVRQSIINI